MKRHVKKYILIVLAMFVLLTITSCGTENRNTGDNNMTFSQMAQSEKKEYVQDYLRDTYGFKSEITADIKKREINSFSSEEQYYAIAKAEDNRRVYCWISDAGKISDSYFVLNMQDDIENLFKDIIDDTVSNFEISCVTTLNYPTEKTYDSSSVFTMLSTEPVTTSIRVFIEGSDKDLIQKEISNIVGEKLNFTDGCIYIYYVDNLMDFDIKDIDLANYDTSFDFKKG